MLFEARSEAIRAFELATQLYPQSVNAWDSLSDGYLESGRTEEALAARDKNIALAKAQGSANLDDFIAKRAMILQQR
jgi:tetratricopeptide (TPR) repeat protein